MPFVFFSSALFIAGAAFSHYLAFPMAFQFFASFQTPQVRFLPRIAPVFSMYAWLLLAMGVMFQLPMLVMVLARLGLVTAGFLARNIKYAVLIIFVVAAVASPGGDPVSQTVTAAPMLVLYVVSIGVAWIFQKRRDDEDDEDSGDARPEPEAERPSVSSALANQAFTTAGLSQRTQVPVGVVEPNGMLRIVACVSALIAASHSAVSHHGEMTNPGRPSIV